MNNNLILKVKNLNVKLGNEETIKDISFEVKEGDVLSILGPNGAGKTTLFKSLLGILPYKGEIEWRPGIKIGYVPERLPYIKDALIDIGEFLSLKGVSENETKEILNLVGLNENFLNKGIGEVSSGQFQRVLVAWALIGDTNVLLFDEPMAGLDIIGEETIYELLAKLRREKNLTILLISHDLSTVYKFSNYVLCLNKCPLCHGVPREVLNPENLQKLYGSEVKFYEHHKH
jgi:zinc transport system ATP-binding protein